jgi:hypothetical protein
MTAQRVYEYKIVEYQGYNAFNTTQKMRIDEGWSIHSWQDSPRALLVMWKRRQRNGSENTESARHST